jgi:hypothetical protein
MENTNRVQPLAEFLKNKGLPTATTEELQTELEKRKLMSPFPLEVFHPSIRPFLDSLHREYDIPRSYIGLSMLSAYSSAVGSAYHVRINKLGNMFFPVWACLEGISSAGKSVIMNQVFKPLYQIQDELEEEWFEKTGGMSEDQIMRLPSKQLIYGEAHIPTLIKDVMPHNPKGVLQDADEILSWINGMNQLAKGGKEGTDEQFWMKSWNCKPHRKRLSGNKIFVIRRPYLNVFGGAQPSIMWKLFKNDRATTGFIFRILFAVPEIHKIADPNLLFDMPEELESLHRKCLTSLYKGLPMDEETDSRPMTIDSHAMRIFKAWSDAKIREVNAQEDPYMLEMLSGIYGKMKEYSLRFAGLLHLADLAYEGKPFGYFETIGAGTMERALKCADYFYASAKNVCERVNTSVIATPEVLRMATFVRAGYTYQQIGDREWPEISESARRIRASRLVKRFIQEYPKIFGADVK